MRQIDSSYRVLLRHVSTKTFRAVKFRKIWQSWVVGNCWAGEWSQLSPQALSPTVGADHFGMPYKFCSVPFPFIHLYTLQVISKQLRKHGQEKRGKTFLKKSLPEDVFPIDCFRVSGGKERWGAERGTLM